MQIHMKNPVFRKVLEQELFRMVTLMGLDLSPDEFERLCNFCIFFPG